jgi:hypothetical protein
MRDIFGEGERKVIKLQGAPETGTIRLRFRYGHQQQVRGEDAVAARKRMSTSQPWEKSATVCGRIDRRSSLASTSSLARLISNLAKKAPQVLSCELKIKEENEIRIHITDANLYTF